MKKIVLILLFLGTCNLFAQKDTIYFDTDWNVKPKKEAVYYRLTNKEEQKFKEFFLFEDYSKESSNKIREGVTLKKEVNAFEGEIVFYAADGTVSERSIFKNGARYGVQKLYYKNGQVKSINYYLLGLLKGLSKNYSPAGILEEEGNYIEDLREGTWTLYYPNGKVKEQGMYLKGNRIGIWKVFYYNGASQDK